MISNTDLAPRLLAWYRQHARDLPWRGHPDPYAVWVSEIMLQQTRVETVIPYFLRWMERFPGVRALAEATEQEVLRYWEGLGYYSRARCLHSAAKKITAEFQGKLPTDRKTLEKLPGVGRYTAGAIASIAFGQDEAALDGNIRRVLARIFDVRLPARSPQGEAVLWTLARETLPSGCAGVFNQALMDLGAAVCTPRSPDCERCPLSEICQARALGVQEERPVAAARPVVPHVTVTAAVISREGFVLITRRPLKGLLGGLWEFPGGKVEESESLPGCLAREIREELGVEISVGKEFGIYHHAYTHFKVTLHAFCCQLQAGEPQPLEASSLYWAQPGELDDFPMGKIDRQIARRLQNTVC